MSATSDWFARQLGSAPSQQQQAPPQYPQQPMPPQYYQPQQQPQGYAPQPQPQYVDEESWRHQAAQQGMAMIKAGQAGLNAVTGLFRGSDKVRRLEHENCPECGDNRYFTREHLRDRRAGTSPAPICMACGYNGLFTQQGADPLSSDVPSIIDQRSAHEYQSHQKVDWTPIHPSQVR